MLIDSFVLYLSTSVTTLASLEVKGNHCASKFSSYTHGVILIDIQGDWPWKHILVEEFFDYVTENLVFEDLSSPDLPFILSWRNFSMQKSFQDLLRKQEGARSAWEYPFAVAGVNITFMLIQMLDIQLGLCLFMSYIWLIS